MKPNIIIRADGGTTIGMGHVVRCLALADMLREEFSIVFAIQEPDNNILKTIHSIVETVIHLPGTTNFSVDCKNFSDYIDSRDIIILDGYNFNSEYQLYLKEKGCKIFVIDDLIGWHHYADIILNHAALVNRSAYSAEGYTKFCLGPEYALLRKPFLSNQSRAREIKRVRNVFISMGAADINNITTKFCNALIGSGGIEEIHLMLGNINPHLKTLKQVQDSSDKLRVHFHFNISAEELAKLLSECDLCICPASSISMESCAIGIPMLSGHTAENQMNILNGLVAHEAAIDLGDLNQITADAITECLDKIKNDPERLNLLVKNQSIMIDGKSPERLLNIFKTLSNADK